MNKLSLDALKQRAEAIASEDLLLTINGGTQDDCHPEPEKEKEKEKGASYEFKIEGGYDKSGPNGKATFTIKW